MIFNLELIPVAPTTSLGIKIKIPVLHGYVDATYSNKQWSFQRESESTAADS